MDVNLTVTGEVERLHVGPQDAVLIKFVANYPIRQEQLEDITKVVRARLAGLEWVDRILVVSGEQVEVSIIEGGNPEPKAAG